MVGYDELIQKRKSLLLSLDVFLISLSQSVVVSVKHTHTHTYTQGTVWESEIERWGGVRGIE